MPRELRQRAELNEWLMFTATELEQPLWRIAKNTALYPEEKRQPSRCRTRARGFRADGRGARRAYEGA